MHHDQLNNRQKQAYASICFWKFCNQLQIQHLAITELFIHLVNIATTDNLADWEQKGLELGIVGRGEPLPEDVVTCVPQVHVESFSSLVEACVEVGIVDMYGNSTEQPGRFLKKCVNILETNNIQVPDIEGVSNLGAGSGPWGEAISNSELQDILKMYRIYTS